MFKRTLSRFSIISTLAVFALPAQAAIIGNLVFTEPTGTVSPNEVIDVYVTLSLDSGSDPISYNSSEPLGGIDPDTLPTTDQYTGEAFASYDHISHYSTRSCSDTFTQSCSDPGSAYTWGAAFGANSWFNWEGTLQAGESIDFHLYTLTPNGGGAPLGLYEAYIVGLGLTVVGTDVNGDHAEADLFGFLTDCADAACTFSREVISPVPIPAAGWLFVSAIAALGLFGHPHRKQRGVVSS